MNARVLLFLLVMAVAVAQAAPKGSKADGFTVYGSTGAELLEQCGDLNKYDSKVGEVVPGKELIHSARNVGLCVGYIAGINDELGIRAAGSKKLLACVPSGVQMDQMIRVVKKWLEDHPTVLHLPSGILVERAIRESFPCQ